jgi:hypothetical protein
MTKRQLIDEIRRLNGAAGEAFLDRFDTPALRRYLDRLQHTGRGERLTPRRADRAEGRAGGYRKAS